MKSILILFSITLLSVQVFALDCPELQGKYSCPATERSEAFQVMIEQTTDSSHINVYTTYTETRSNWTKKKAFTPDSIMYIVSGDNSLTKYKAECRGVEVKIFNWTGKDENDQGSSVINFYWLDDRKNLVLKDEYDDGTPAGTYTSEVTCLVSSTK